jgi:hypothetical protein
MTNEHGSGKPLHIGKLFHICQCFISFALFVIFEAALIPVFPANRRCQHLLKIITEFSHG